MIDIKPFGNQILVKPVEVKRALADEKGSLCEYGEVIAIGRNVDVSIYVGDTIGFTVWGLNSLDINGEKHYFVQAEPEFILGTINMPQQLSA